MKTLISQANVSEDICNFETQILLIKNWEVNKTNVFMSYLEVPVSSIIFCLFKSASCIAASHFSSIFLNFSAELSLCF